MQETSISPRNLVLLLAFAVMLVLAGGMVLGMRESNKVEAQAESLTWHVFDLRQWNTAFIVGSELPDPRPFVE